MVRMTVVGVVWIEARFASFFVSFGCCRFKDVNNL